MSHVVSIIDPVQILSREILQQLESADPDWVGELRLLGPKPNMELYFKDEPIAVQPATSETRKGVEIALFGGPSCRSSRAGTWRASALLKSGML